MDTKKLRTIKNYNYGIYSLAIFAAFSFVNVFLLAFDGKYYVFSSYLNTFVITILIEISSDYLLAAILIALALIVPYVICAVFARKHFAFMIAGLVLVVADTVLLLVFSIPGALVDNLLDIVCHAIIIGELVIALVNKDGPKYVKEQKESKSSAPDSVSEEVLPSGETVAVLKDSETFSENESVFNNLQRQITVKRKKSFYACAVKLDVVIDGVTVATLKNGQAQTVKVSGGTHSMCAHFGFGSSDVLQIPEGACDKEYEFRFVMKMTTTEVKITELK